jgi:hypothetical protein
MPSPSAPGIPTGFVVMFVIIVILAVVGVIAGIATGRRRASVLRSGGLSPLYAREQLEVELAKNLRAAAGPPAPGQPAKTTEQRLAELDNLHERGVISGEERAAGRARIIGGG